MSEAVTMEVNVEAIIGLAVSTAFFQQGFDNTTTQKEFNTDGDWSDLLESAESYLKWVGVKTKKLTRRDVKDTLWPSF